MTAVIASNASGTVSSPKLLEVSGRPLKTSKEERVSLQNRARCLLQSRPVNPGTVRACKDPRRQPDITPAFDRSQVDLTRVPQLGDDVGAELTDAVIVVPLVVPGHKVGRRLPLPR